MIPILILLILFSFLVFIWDNLRLIRKNSDQQLKQNEQLIKLLEEIKQK